MGQQNNMGYLLKDKFHSIYFKYGSDIYFTLGLANYRNIHTSLNFISFEQFNNDSGYLYNALKQALKSKGSDLVIQQNESQD